MGANFRLILPDASKTPADAIPITMCIITNKGIVRKYFSGIVVKVHARIEKMNKGPLMARTDLLLNRSVYLPHSFKNKKLNTWLVIESPIINDMPSPNLLSM